MMTLPGCDAKASAILAISARTFASGTADPTGNMLYVASSVSPMRAPSGVARTLRIGAVPVMMACVDFSTALPMAAATLSGDGLWTGATIGSAAAAAADAAGVVPAGASGGA